MIRAAGGEVNHFRHVLGGKRGRAAVHGGGAIPIAVGWGAGASTRRPLGVAVVGGLAFSQLVTLYETPVFYTYLDELQTRFARGRAAAELAGSPLAEGASAD